MISFTRLINNVRSRLYNQPVYIPGYVYSPWKKWLVIVTMAIPLLLVVYGFLNHDPEKSAISKTQSVIVARSPNSNTGSRAVEKVQPTCDGLTVKSNCSVDGISYSRYVYHPALSEKSHSEKIISYKQEVSGYCTLCVDSTYSPSCATGRGACSHHGGVAQWNAPRYTNIPVYTTKTVIDTPAQPEYYEKITK
jgi:hypothetical protein